MARPLQAADPYYGVCRISRGRFADLVRRLAAPAVVAERDPGEYWDACMAERVDPLFVLAIFGHESTYGRYGAAVETHSWGNTRPPSFGVPQIGTYAQSGGRLLSRYATWLDGCRSTAARLAAPSFYYRQERRTIGEVFNDPLHRDPPVEWAPAGDGNDPGGYLASVLAFMTREQEEEQVMERPAILDVRSLLPTNPRGGSGARSAPKRGIIIHYSGPAVDRSAETLAILRSYAAYHIGPYLGEAGIAYHFDVGNDALIRQTRDRDAVLWHCGAWPENETHYAVHVMIGDEQHATPEQLAALTALVAWLRDEDGIAREEVKGHQEVSSTSCPGTLMGDFVLPYRAGRDAVVADGWRFPETGRYVAGGFYAYWRDRGGLAVYGLPLTEEVREVCADGQERTVQYFERAVFEYHPENEPAYQVLLRRLGAAAAAAAGHQGPGIG